MSDSNIDVERPSCNRCDGTGRIPRSGSGFAHGENEGATDPCPSCNGLGWREVVRVKQDAIDRLKGDNEDHMRCCGTVEPQYNCPETVGIR